jgi:16S rRNA (guanine527-N7)-methyltransferase
LSHRLAELAAALAAPEAPSTVRDVWADHIEDARSGLPAVGEPATIADLGSGNGVPGLVLADALPDTQVFCVEAARKKADWIAATAARCGLGNVEAVWARAEEWDGRVDVVVARALAALPVLCEYAAPLLTEGGRAVFWKGAVDADEEADGRHAASVLGLSEPSVTPVPGTERRSLWVFHRLGSVPPGYPRRAGMAAKRPLVRVRNAR